MTVLVLMVGLLVYMSLFFFLQDIKEAGRRVQSNLLREA
jgi:hypothetical protein